MIIINKRNIEKKAKKYNWEGNGTKEHPYIIENNELTNPLILFRNVRHFILVRNCNIKYVNLFKCWNIIFEKCNLRKVDLIKCQFIEINNCGIKKIKQFVLSSNITIKNTRIKNLEHHYFCQGLIFINNEIQKKYIKRIKQDKHGIFSYLFNMRFYLLVMILGFIGIPVVLLQFFQDIIASPFIYIFLSFSSILMSFLIALYIFFSIKHKNYYLKIKEIQPDIVKNNKVIILK